MSKKTYFQFQKEIALPIFIAVDLTSMEPAFQEFLQSMKFTKLTEKEEADALKNLQSNKHARVLNLTEASPVVARQIRSIMETDRYGAESVIPKEGYRVYRYKDVGLMIYSFMARDWQLGCDKNFGANEIKFESRMMINRFLSLSLSSFGIVGLFGVSVDGGVVVQRPIDSKGEVVFIDVVAMRMMGVDGVKKLKSDFKILRLDPMLKGRNIKMSSEELLSFLSSHSSYMDYSGLSVPVRQAIQAMSKMTVGLIHPEESFRPRTDLSL